MKRSLIVLMIVTTLLLTACGNKTTSTSVNDANTTLTNEEEEVTTSTEEVVEEIEAEPEIEEYGFKIWLGNERIVLTSSLIKDISQITQSTLTGVYSEGEELTVDGFTSELDNEQITLILVNKDTLYSVIALNPLKELKQIEDYIIIGINTPLDNSFGSICLQSKENTITSYHDVVEMLDRYEDTITEFNSKNIYTWLNVDECSIQLTEYGENQSDINVFFANFKETNR